METILTNIVAAVNDVLWNKYLLLLFLLLLLLRLPQSDLPQLKDLFLKNLHPQLLPAQNQSLLPVHRHILTEVN